MVYWLIKLIIFFNISVNLLILDKFVKCLIQIDWMCLQQSHMNIKTCLNNFNIIYCKSGIIPLAALVHCKVCSHYQYQTLYPYVIDSWYPRPFFVLIYLYVNQSKNRPAKKTSNNLLVNIHMGLEFLLEIIG